MIRPVLLDRQNARFWFAVIATGLGTGAAAAAMAGLLSLVQHAAWPHGVTLLASARLAPAWRHVAVLAVAGVLTGAIQLLLSTMKSGSAIDITEAIVFHAGRIARARTLISATLSVTIVGMGASLGREGAPKQAGAVMANIAADRARLSDEHRRLLVACAAGAGMAAAYGVPVGGALFALEVLRGELALRYVLPALTISVLATSVAWLAVPDAPTYPIGPNAAPFSVMVFALFFGPATGILAAVFVRAVALVDKYRPRTAWLRAVSPVLALTAVGAVSIAFPEILGNGKDTALLALRGMVPLTTLLALCALKPAATLLCLGSGAPGGLFTPTLTAGALFGAAAGHAWSWMVPGAPPGLFALLGAAALLAATTQGPVSSIVLVMELTGQARAAIVPTLLVVTLASVVSRTMEARSIYDARLPEDEARARQRARTGI